MKKKIKLIVVAIALVLVCVAVAGCGGNGSNDNKANNKTINIVLHQDPPKLDPYYSTAFVERHVFQSIFDKLVDNDGKGNIIPMLAEKWEISPDGKKYTFFLKKGVKFHDGTEFNAEAVKFNIEHYKEKNSSRKNELKNISKITIVDSNTIEFELSKPFAPLLYILADRAGMMCSPDAVKKAGDKFMNAPVGTGPYMFKSRIKGNSITLVKNPNYWKPGMPKNDVLVYKIITDANVALVNLKSGQVDMTNRFPFSEAGKYKDDNKISVINEPGPGFKGIVLNTIDDNLKDVRIRQAIEKTIDRETIVNVALSGVGTPGRTALPPNNFAYDANIDVPQKPDIEGAKALLKAAGKADGFKFTLSTDTDPTSQQVAQLIQKMLKEINVEVVIDKQDLGTLLDRAKKGNFQAAMIGWSGRMDPDQNIYDWMYTDANMNYMKYSNPQIDNLLDEARTVTDNETRKNIYKNIMNTLASDSPYIYLYHEHNIFGMSKQLSGFTPNPDGMIRTFDLSK